MTTNEHRSGQSGMVLCAGLGTRMRPLTLTRPKPLVEVAGKTLMEYALEQLEDNQVKNIVVNVHYLADQIESWLKDSDRTNIAISDERQELLETGGGVVKAKKQLGDSAFFVLNSDAFWIDRKDTSTLANMRAAFDDDKMDFLLLLSSHEQSVGYDGKGDFFIADDGRVKRRGQAATAPYVFAGCYMIHPRVLEDCPSGPFSMNLLWNRALERGRVFGLLHDGLWLHVGTPEAIGQAEEAIRHFQRETS